MSQIVHMTINRISDLPNATTIICSDSKVCRVLIELMCFRIPDPSISSSQSPSLSPLIFHFLGICVSSMAIWQLSRPPSLLFTGCGSPAGWMGIRNVDYNNRVDTKTAHVLGDIILFEHNKQLPWGSDPNQGGLPHLIHIGIVSHVVVRPTTSRSKDEEEEILVIDGIEPERDTFVKFDEAVLGSDR